MDDLNFTVLESHAALVVALLTLRYTPQDKLVQIYRIIYGDDMKDSDVKKHAAVREKMFDALLKDFDERYRTQLSDLQEQMDCAEASPALT